MKQNKILLYGLPCVGKSHSIASLLKIPNAKLVYLTTDRNALAGFTQGLATYKITPKEGQISIAGIETKNEKVFETTFTALETFVQQSQGQAQQSSDKSNMNKDKYTFYLDVVGKLKSFSAEDYVTGEKVNFGNIGLLDKETILVIDGLTPITHAMWNIVKGDRIITQISDYQTVQHLLKELTDQLVRIKCSVILLAHADLTMDDVEKKEKIRVALNAGVALHGAYGGYWGNVIYAYQAPNGKYVWAGKKLNVDTAARDLPQADMLEPDFSKYNFF